MTAVGILVRSSHPIPAVAVTGITLVFGLSIGLEDWRLVLLVSVALLNQASVGLSNDWLDYRRDAAALRGGKPLVQDQRHVGLVRNVAFVCLSVSLVAPLLLGWQCALAHLIAVASGWAYNLKLKGTVASVVPYFTSFGLLPVVVTLAQADFTLPPGSTVIAGSLLGVSAHFANVLPDIEEDLRNGIRGLPHRLGLVRSAVIIVSTMCAGTLVTAWSILPTHPAVGVASISAAAALAVTTSLVIAANPRSRWLFKLILLSGLVNVFTLALSLADSRLLTI